MLEQVRARIKRKLMPDKSQPGGSQPEQLQDADAILWTLDRDPFLRSTIAAVALFDREPPFEELVKRLEALCHKMHHFRSTVTPPSVPWGRPRWRVDPNFDVISHLRHVRAPLPGDLRGVLDLAQAMAQTAFDPARPLWEMMLVDGMAEGQAALIIKVHHSVVDGVGGLQVVGSVLDLDRQGTPMSDEHVGGRAHHRRAVDPSRLRAITSVVKAAAAAPRCLVSSAEQAASDPSGSARRWFETLADAASLVAPSPMPLSPLLRGRSLNRHFEILDLPGGTFYEASEGTGLTLNDVFMSGLLRGLSLYHHRHHRPATDLRAVMPISTRRPNDPLDTNRFIPVRLVLPANLRDAQVYLQQVPALLSRWKHTGAMGVSDLMTSALGRLPAPVTVGIFTQMLKGVDFTATDVPGSAVEAYFAGARVESFYAFAPTAGSAVNAALVTTAGRPSIGLNIDPAAVPDPTLFVSCLGRAFEEVCVAATSGRSI